MSDRLIDLLDAQYKALLGGRFSDLPGLAESIEQAMTEPDLRMGSAAAVIYRKAMRNKACLAAALSGMKSAQIRIREITKAARGLTTYDASGATSVLMATANTCRRA